RAGLQPRGHPRRDGQTDPRRRQARLLHRRGRHVAHRHGPGAHAELGLQTIQRYGYDASLRFAWDTVPRWPMGFAVHITDMPKGAVLNNATPENPLTDGGAPTGIRALYDVGFRATGNVTVLAKVGSQAPYSLGGGPTGR